MTITELRERVQAATGPDRAIDWEFHVLHGLDGAGMYGAHPHYTASIDAALALVERCVPGEKIVVEKMPSGRGYVTVGYGLLRPWADGPTPPLAILSALLWAIEAGVKS